MAPDRVRSPRLSRRNLLQAGATGAVLAATGVLSGCAADVGADGTQLVHGATGGSLKDSLDPHHPVTVPDIARVRSLYETLIRYSAEYELEPGLAESWEPNAEGTVWTFRLREDVTFHNGKPVTAEDVAYSLERMTDPDNPAAYAVPIMNLIDRAASGAVDPRTYQLHLSEPFAIVPQVLANYSLGIVPTDFDPAAPVGTGPFAYRSFVPGQRSTFSRNADYWDTIAAYDELVILNFTDDAAKVNALLAGQVQTIDNLPSYLAGAVENQGARTLIAQTGGWIPFTMRVDLEPFSDQRVREALRLTVNRRETIDQAWNGYGRVGNDIYSPFDPAYAGDQFPQREQDVERARFLLKQAGREDLQVELVTSTGVGAGAVESANMFAQQARQVGFDVRVNKVDSSIFYGEQYLSWPFAQDFWNTRPYLPQAGACALPDAAYNETHFNHPQFNELIHAAQRELDEQRRTRLIQDAQRIEYEEGGLIIWGFNDQIDAYSQFVTGLVPAVEQPMSSYRFNLARPAS